MNILMYSRMGDGDGGGETVFQRVGEGLEGQGHEVTRVFANAELPPGARMEDRNKSFIGLSTPPSWQFFLRFNHAVDFVKSLLGLFCLLWRVQPDVVNYHYYSKGALHFALLKRIFGYRFVVSCHGSDVVKMNAMHRQVAPLVFSKADGVTCVSQALSERLREKVGIDLPVQVIYNGIDTTFWSDGRSVRGASRAKHLVSVGALRDVKGHDVLIRAFQRVAQQHPGVTLRIVGDGPNRSMYETLIKEAELGDRVCISGWCSPNEVRAALREASIFVFPSRYEGFGIALVEAMAAGCPVVASDVGGIPEVVSGTSARLVSPNDPVALAETLERSLDDDQWREEAGRASEKRASRFCWEAVVDAYEKCLRSP